MEHYMPFGSSNGDRKVTSADFARYFGAFIGDGVLVNPSTNLQVLANSGMTVTLKLGMGFINHGYFYYNDGDLTLTIDVADGVLNRKDNIVLRWDISTRTVSAQVVKGTPASSAVAPALVRTNEQYDLKVAEISIPAGTTAITQGLITDTRANSSVCGYSTGVLQQIDATTLFAQFTSSFNTWFDEMKGQLSTDAAGHLQNEIDAHKSDHNNPHQVTAAQVGAITNAPVQRDIDPNNCITDGTVYHVYSSTGTLPPGYTSGDNDFFLFVNSTGAGWVRQIFIDCRSTAIFTRVEMAGTWYPWQKPDAYHADYASGLNPETAPCLINGRMLPYKDSTIPTGTNGIIVWRLDVASS